MLTFLRSRDPQYRWGPPPSRRSTPGAEFAIALICFAIAAGLGAGLYALADTLTREPIHTLGWWQLPAFLPSLALTLAPLWRWKQRRDVTRVARGELDGDTAARRALWSLCALMVLPAISGLFLFEPILKSLSSPNSARNWGAPLAIFFGILATEFGVMVFLMRAFARRQIAMRIKRDDVSEPTQHKLPASACARRKVAIGWAVGTVLLTLIVQLPIWLHHSHPYNQDWSQLTLAILLGPLALGAALVPTWNWWQTRRYALVDEEEPHETHTIYEEVIFDTSPVKETQEVTEEAPAYA